jgi:IS5 family transposase
VQQRDDTNKVYNIHEPEVLCMYKGKEHKQYPSGNKSPFTYNSKPRIIIVEMALYGDVYNGYTLKTTTEAGFPVRYQADTYPKI